MLYKHVKRGTVYEVIEGDVFLHEFSSEGSIHTFHLGHELIVAEFQYSQGEKDGSRYAGPVVLYKGLDNKFWLRPPFEFNDGRFIQL